jgi:preprotein translocase SecE subunit
MTKDDSFWVNTAYITMAIICAYIGYKAIYTAGIQMGWTERYDSWFPLVSNFGSMLFGLGVTMWFRSSSDRREYHLAAVAESRKVAWPNMADTKRMTLVVVVVVAVFSVILGVFDLLWSAVLKQIIS